MALPLTPAPVTRLESDAVIISGQQMVTSPLVVVSGPKRTGNDTKRVIVTKAHVNCCNQLIINICGLLLSIIVLLHCN